MANLAVQKPALLAAVPTSNTTAGGGDNITGVSSGTPLYLRFTVGATPSTVTIDDPTSQQPEQAAAFNPDLTFTVAASTSRIIKISNPARFINPSTGVVALTYTSVTGLVVEIWQ